MCGHIYSFFLVYLYTHMYVHTRLYIGGRPSSAEIYSGSIGSALFLEFSVVYPRRMSHSQQNGTWKVTLTPIPIYSCMPTHSTAASCTIAVGQYACPL